MANYLGLRAETVNRALNELRRRQLIVPEGNVVTIIDLAGLAVSAGNTLDAKEQSCAWQRAAAGDSGSFLSSHHIAGAVDLFHFSVARGQGLIRHQGICRTP